MTFTKKNLLIAALIIGLSFGLFGNSMSPKTKGSIKTDQNSYEFIRTGNQLKVFKKDKEIFTHQAKDSEEIISTGYSSVMKSLYCFKTALKGNNKKSLICVTPAGEEIVIENFDSSIYYPAFIGNSGRKVVYIDSSFTLNIFDLDNRRVLHKLKFPNPIYRLSLKGTNSSESVFFQTLKGISDQEISFLSQNVDSSEIKFQYGEILNSPRRNSGAARNFRSFLCIGDSITRGKVGGQIRPDLGYIPRLADLIQLHLYKQEDPYMVNYGKNGEITRTMLKNLSNIIGNHDSGFLLLHMGTNDKPVANISPMQTFLNLKEMAITAKRYGMIPVMSTLIPRTYKGSATENFRGYNEETNNYLRAFAVEAAVPLADFWNIFINHPGYDDPSSGIMSDYVHPGREGYQLMAEEWIKRIPPVEPTITSEEETPGGTVIEWYSAEADIKNFIIKYGYTEENLNKQTVVDEATRSMKIMSPIMNSPFSYKFFYKVIAIDNDDNKSGNKL